MNFGSDRIGAKAQMFWALTNHIYIISCSDHPMLRLSQGPMLCWPVLRLLDEYCAWGSAFRLLDWDPSYRRQNHPQSEAGIDPATTLIYLACGDHNQIW